MTAQRRLLDPGPGLANLTAREQLVFDYVQTHPGQRAFDIGRYYHREKVNPCLYCSDDRTCQYAARDANTILTDLRGHSDNPHARRLVTRRQDGKWYSLVPAERDTGELPDGY